MFRKIINFSSPFCIITDLVILTLAVLEVKDRIVKRRMKKEHVSPKNSNEQE